MKLRLSRITGPFNMAILASLYPRMRFWGVTWGHWGFGLSQYLKERRDSD